MKAAGISNLKICALGLYLCFSLPLTAAHNEGKPDLDNTERAQVEEDSATSPNVDSSDSNLLGKINEETDPEKLKNLLGQAPPEELEALRNQLEAQETLSPVQEQVLQKLRGAIEDSKKSNVQVLPIFRWWSQNSIESSDLSRSSLFQSSPNTSGSMMKVLQTPTANGGANVGSSSEKSSAQNKPEVSGKPLAKERDYYMTAPNGREFPAFRDANKPGAVVAPEFKSDGTVDTTRVQILNTSTQRSVTKPSSELGYQVDRNGQIHSVSDPVLKNISQIPKKPR